MIVLGVGEYGATAQKGEVIRTIGLGSCIAVVCHEPIAGIAGMIHIALPDSSISQVQPVPKLGYYADTGLPAFFESMGRVGWRKGVGRLSVKLAGGASILDPNGTFNIGKRNLLAIKRILWGLGLGPIAEDVGGNHSRTVTIAAETGAITITTPGREPVSL
jgi:chemotaxis protein CheD